MDSNRGLDLLRRRALHDRSRFDRLSIHRPRYCLQRPDTVDRLLRGFDSPARLPIHEPRPHSRPAGRNRQGRECDSAAGGGYPGRQQHREQPERPRPEPQRRRGDGALDGGPHANQFTLRVHSQQSGGQRRRERLDLIRQLEGHQRASRRDRQPRVVGDTELRDSSPASTFSNGLGREHQPPPHRASRRAARAYLRLGLGRAGARRQYDCYSDSPRTVRRPTDDLPR